MHLDIVFVTKLDHLYTLNLSINYLKFFYPDSNIYIVTKKSNFKFFKGLNYDKIILINEEELLPDMSLALLKKSKHPFFPKRAGWYYQQFLKLAVSNLNEISDNYVIIDADTIILQNINFFKENKYVFLKATEYHLPYFTNYKNLLFEEPNREFSFISQYMVFNKKIVTEMLDKISANFKNNYSWNWTIINNLSGNDASLFSEYETYGHYIKNHYPEKCIFSNLPWLRDATKMTGTMFPSKKTLKFLESKYYLVSFEHQERRFLNKIFKHFICKIYPYIFMIKTFFS